MIISAHQPAYLPWLGYFHKILLCDTFVIMDDVQFEKNSFTNRNRVLSSGQEIMLTVPVKTKGHLSSSIRDIEIADLRWRTKHLRTIEQAYGKLPFFSTVMHWLYPILSREEKYLVNYTTPFLFSLLEYLGIERTIVLASELAIRETKLNYVIELTGKLGGDMFVFGQLGKEYADISRLTESGIEAYFQDYQHPEYSQGKGSFKPNCSILDLIFRESADKSVEIIQAGNISKDELLCKIA